MKKHGIPAKLILTLNTAKDAELHTLALFDTQYILTE